MTTIQPLADHQKRGINIVFTHLEWASGILGPVLQERPKQGDKAYATRLAQAASVSGRMLTWAMGAGKTRAGLTLIALWDSWVKDNIPDEYVVLKQSLIRPILIIGEASGIHVWRNELRKWFPDAPENYIVSAVNGSDIESCVGEMALGNSRAMTISYSMLTRHLDKLLVMPYGLCILDEIQAITNQDSARSKAIHALKHFRPDGSQGIAFTLGLSGTPFTNRIGDLWPVLTTVQGYSFARKIAGRQVYTIQSAVWGKRSEFNDKYVVQTGTGIVGKNLTHDPRRYVSCAFHREEDCENLHPRMKRWIMHRVTADEAWPNLPGADLIWSTVKMGEEQRNLYDDLVGNLIIPAYDERGHERDLKIHQMALMTYAFEALASGNQVLFSLRNKIPDAALRFGSSESCIKQEVERILSEMESHERAIVFTGFEQFANELADYAPIRALNPIVLSGNSGWTSEAAERAFQDPKSKHRVMIGTTKMVKALTLTAARYCIIAGFLSYSPWDIMQAIYRIRRPGQAAEHLMIYGISVEDSLLQWLKNRLATKLEYGLQALDGRAGGAEELGIEQLTHRQFVDAFRGK